MAVEITEKALAEFADRVERNRRHFKIQFGNFEEAEIETYWLGTSEDGAYLAFQFGRPDGSTHRFAMPSEWVQQFVYELAGATDDMNQRRVAAALIKVEPKGKA